MRAIPFSFMLMLSKNESEILTQSQRLNALLFLQSESFEDQSYAFVSYHVVRQVQCPHRRGFDDEILYQLAVL
jgi:hypothetical protein